MDAVSCCVSAGMGKLFGWSGTKYMQSLILSMSLSNKKNTHFALIAVVHMLVHILLKTLSHFR